MNATIRKQLRALGKNKCIRVYIESKLDRSSVVHIGGEDKPLTVYKIKFFGIHPDETHTIRENADRLIADITELMYNSDSEANTPPMFDNVCSVQFEAW